MTFINLIKISINNILLFLMILLASCSYHYELIPFEIGKDLKSENIIIKDSIERVKTIKRAVYKNDTTITLYVFGSKNSLYHLINEDVSERDIHKYIDYLSVKFDSDPVSFNKKIVANNFIGRGYEWKNDNGDVAVIVTWKNVNDTMTSSLNNWTVELYNDTLIEATRNGN